MRCDNDRCKNEAVFVTIPVSNSHCLSKDNLCKEHCVAFLDHYLLDAGAQGNIDGAVDGMPSFEVVLLLFDYQKENPQFMSRVYQREIGGMARSFCWEFGYCETTFIHHSLGGTSVSKRPLTHPTMASTIVALGGQIEDVLVWDFNRSDKYHFAKLRIRQSEQLLEIDLRPSDGLALAILSKAPFRIAEHLL